MPAGAGKFLEERDRCSDTLRRIYDNPALDANEVTGLPSLHRNYDSRRKATAIGGRLIIFPAIFQLICKLPYLFFPLDIHDSSRIVVKAVVQKVEKSSFEFCPF
jgi:hypothetical protein